MSQDSAIVAAQHAPAASPGRAWPRWRTDLLFFGLSLGLAFLVFGKACTGGNLLVPLDIPAKLCRHFHWLEPNAGPIPQNHWVVDIFDHELPRHYSIYQALRRGEFPWWDPYTDSGRPLVAEAHISGTDPFRLALYSVLPFEWAYNWSKILSCLLFGWGAYLLLRSQGFPGWVNIGCALAYQFASNHFLFLTPLCVSASLAYYGLLWWAWARLASGFSWGYFALASLLGAAVFMAGNQQTHAFLGVFVACFLLGYGFRNRAVWKSLVAGTLASLFVGALVALPILTAQAELFLLCSRPTPDHTRLGWLTGLANSSALFPWLLGTFRTLDAGKAFGQYGVGFSVYIGSAGIILAAGGALAYLKGNQPAGLVRTALLLVVAYEIICLTRLRDFLYLRCSDLAVLGLVVLAAYLLNGFTRLEIPSAARRLMGLLSLGCVGACLAANILAFVVVPRLESRLEQFVLKRDEKNAGLPNLAQFRTFQVENLKREISLQNLETMAAMASAAGLWFLLRRKATADGLATARYTQAVLALNLVPLLLFAHRFVPSQPVDLWHRLVREDSEQTRIAARFGLQYRYREPEARPAAQVGGSLGHLFGRFPGTTAHLYRLHSTQGYSSFYMPPVASEFASLGLSLAESDMSLASAGSDRDQVLPAGPPSGTSRFQWKTPMARQVTVVAESLNQVTIQVAAGTPGTLVRTDRYYPGWRVVEPAGLKGSPLGRSLFEVEVPPGETRISFAYTPRFFAATLPLSLLGLGICLGGGVGSVLRRRKP